MPVRVPLGRRFSYNYLPGSLPKPGATLKVLDTQANFLSGTFPTTALAPIVSPSVAKVPNSAAAPTLTMASAAVPLDATSVSALLSLGAALGVRDTNWRNGSKCNIEGQTANFKTWPGVWCIANGTVLNIDLSYNIFFGQLSKLVSNLLPLTSMATLRLAANYLTGTLLAMATQLQRTSGCAVCGSATGAPPFCAGTTCTPDVAARLAAGTINNPAAALPAMFCQAVLVDDNSGDAGAVGTEGGAGRECEQLGGRLTLQAGGQRPRGGQLDGRCLRPLGPSP
ncbi:unnamed protein product [Closterium sp. NIES-65]|nr:unnamed protein product [Closterium sp. NIES-65]